MDFKSCEFFTLVVVCVITWYSWFSILDAIGYENEEFERVSRESVCIKVCFELPTLLFLSVDCVHLLFDWKYEKIDFVTENIWIPFSFIRSGATLKTSKSAA